MKDNGQERRNEKFNEARETITSNVNALITTMKAWKSTDITISEKQTVRILKKAIKNLENKELLPYMKELNHYPIKLIKEAKILIDTLEASYRRRTYRATN